MGIFRRFGRHAETAEPNRLPCASAPCPYEYDGESDRDIEGMPFAEGDARSCPQYGHICPEFMEAFGLSVEELNIRATIHCGALIDHLVQEGKADLDSDGVKLLLERFNEVLRDYPPDRFPRYWDSTLDEV